MYSKWQVFPKQNFPMWWSNRNVPCATLLGIRHSSIYPLLTLFSAISTRGSNFGTRSSFHLSYCTSVIIRWTKRSLGPSDGPTSSRGSAFAGSQSFVGNQRPVIQNASLDAHPSVANVNPTLPDGLATLFIALYRVCPRIGQHPMSTTDR